MSNNPKQITFALDEPFDVEFVNNAVKQFPNNEIFVQIFNTKGISSEELKKISPKVRIRVIGGYTQERINNCAWRRPNNGKYYTDAVIYSREELLHIIIEMEKIEKDIHPTWSKEQKLVHIYDKLKTSIMYDPRYETSPDEEVRSLRPLVSKKGVCAGYSLILKEMLERQGIECDYVESNSHAWNLVFIDGNIYPIDLTWDNDMFRRGVYNSTNFLGQGVKQFAKTHVPLSWERIQNYEETLSELDPSFIKEVLGRSRRERTYESTSFTATRDDGSKYHICQVGQATIKGVDYYRYYYSEVLPNGELQEPTIIYSESNVLKINQSELFGKPIPPGYKDAVLEILLSKDNIIDSKKRGTSYIGGVRKNPGQKGPPDFVTDYKQIVKPKEKTDLFSREVKTFTRDDGTKILVEYMSTKTPEGTTVYHYDIFEMINDRSNMYLKKNTVFTETDIMKLDSNIVSKFLTRDRIDYAMQTYSGYLGYYDEQSHSIKRNPTIKTQLLSSKRVDAKSPPSRH